MICSELCLKSPKKIVRTTINCVVSLRKLFLSTDNRINIYVFSVKKPHLAEIKDIYLELSIL